MTGSHPDGRFTGASGGSIYWQGWLPDGPVTGVVVLVHGLAEHGGRYAHVGERLAGAGYAGYAADHRGHGRSDGTRGNIDRMAHVVADLHSMVQLAGGRHPEVPVFLLGHSMGGLIALQYATGAPAPLSGLVLSAPAVQIAVGSRAQRASAAVLSAVAPNLGVLRLDATAVSRDPDVVRDYDTDPLNYRGRIRVRTGTEMLRTAQAIAGRLTRITMPVLVLHGSADRLVTPGGSAVVAAAVASSDVTHREYPGLYHEVFNEPEQESVLDDLVEWLTAHR